jgi:ribosomal protein L17
MLYTLFAQFSNQPARTYMNTRHVESQIETRDMKAKECRGHIDEVCTLCAQGYLNTLFVVVRNLRFGS